MKTASEIRLFKLGVLAKEVGTLRALAERCDTSEAYLSQIMTGQPDSKTGKPKSVGNALARKLEDGTGKSRGWMDTPDTDRPTGIRDQRVERSRDANTDLGPDIKGRVPLISWVQAGDWNSVVDNFHPGDADEWIDTTVPVRQHTYALRVKGDSMTNPTGSPSFPHGMIIIVEPEIDAVPGAYVVVRQNGDDECTFKQLVKDAGNFYLKPLNPAYPLLRMTDDAVICGVVREATMRFF